MGTREIARSITALDPNALPIGDLTNWNQVVAEDFNDASTTGTSTGSFLDVYGSDWYGYDTDGVSGFTDTSGNGNYKPSVVVTTHDSVLDMNLHTTTGVHYVAATMPRGYNGQTYGRYAMRFKADAGLMNYKTAWLLWPASGLWPDGGEVDMVEGDLDGQWGSNTAHAQPFGSGALFDSFAANEDYLSWHIFVCEWTPGYLTFYRDGVCYGSTTFETPDTDMYFVLQTETNTNAADPPDNATTGHVLIDWVAVWEWTGSLTPATAAKFATFIDDMSSEDRTKWFWDNYIPTELSQSGSGASILASDNYPTLISCSCFDLTASSVYIDMVTHPNYASDLSISSQITLQVSIGGLTRDTGVNGLAYVIYLDGGVVTLHMRETVNDTNSETTVAYSATTMKYLRFREASGTVFWETSPDASTWTSRRSKTSTLNYTGASLSINAGNYNSVTTPGSLVVGGVNTTS